MHIVAGQGLDVYEERRKKHDAFKKANDAPHQIA